jgi:hypothetical protein
MRYSRFRFASRFSGTLTSRALALLVVLMYASRAHAAGDRPTALDAKQVQAIVDQYRQALAIPQRVTVTLVEHNPLVASVERHPVKRNVFVLSLERGFAEGLSKDELAAVLAHELGHVWIFTHFPYLQTEGQANQVAMRVVKRERLEQVYAKVWAHVGGTSTVAQFMTPSSPAPTPVQAIAPRTAVEPASTASTAGTPVRK